MVMENSKSAATGYTDYFKKNSSGATAADRTELSPEDKKKDAIRRRLEKLRKRKAK